MAKPKSALSFVPWETMWGPQEGHQHAQRRRHHPRVRTMTRAFAKHEELKPPGCRGPAPPSEAPHSAQLPRTVSKRQHPPCRSCRERTNSTRESPGPGSFTPQHLGCSRPGHHHYPLQLSGMHALNSQSFLSQVTVRACPDPDVGCGWGRNDAAGLGVGRLGPLLRAVEKSGRAGAWREW